MFINRHLTVNLYFNEKMYWKCCVKLLDLVLLLPRWRRLWRLWMWRSYPTAQLSLSGREPCSSSSRLDKDLYLYSPSLCCLPALLSPRGPSTTTSTTQSLNLLFWSLLLLLLQAHRFGGFWRSENIFVLSIISECHQSLDYVILVVGGQWMDRQQ